MTTITFLRMRPGDRVTEQWSVARYREGSTAVEVAALTAEDRAAAIAGGLLPVGDGQTDPQPVGYVTTPETAIALTDAGVPGWRITVKASDAREPTLDALARSEAAFLRVGRSHLDAGAAMA